MTLCIGRSLVLSHLLCHLTTFSARVVALFSRLGPISRSTRLSLYIGADVFMMRIHLRRGSRVWRKLVSSDFSTSSLLLACFVPLFICWRRKNSKWCYIIWFIMTYIHFLRGLVRPWTSFYCLLLYMWVFNAYL